MSETSVDIQLRTRQYIPEDSEPYTRRRQNFKSHIHLRCLVYSCAALNTSHRGRNIPKKKANKYNKTNHGTLVPRRKGDCHLAGPRFGGAA
jgi:hypothetical protein